MQLYISNKENLYKILFFKKMMADNFTEMIHFLEDVAKVNQAITLPFLHKKTGLKILDKGQDHGMIVTQADKKVSQYLLDGGIESIPGIREVYSGSFSEEDDSIERVNSLTIYQIDPIDGTGDMVDSYKSSRVVSPTTLVSKLERKNISENFVPVSGLIFDVLNGFGLVSDGNENGLYKIEGDKIKEIIYEKKEHPWKDGDTIKINRRVSYPQLTFDGPFMDYLQSQFKIERVNVGGAGTFAMQFFRNYIEPKEFVKGFSDLETVTLMFNAQPDWKTWDTDPTEVVANALGLPERTDIYGKELKTNASTQKLSNMHHKYGYVLSHDKNLRTELTNLAEEFTRKNPNCLLTKKDYSYKDAIVSLVQ